MIHITDKTTCCGCGGCVQICPKHCISIQKDDEGFFYPEVSIAQCVDCGLCDSVCPIINTKPIQLPLTAVAYRYPDNETHIKCTSGGVATLLSEKVIGQKGVVFGAKFDDKWTVIHDFADTTNGIESFRGSKYVQSDIGSCFQIAEQFLKQGKLVLFTGTPCQISGLKSFLRKDYDNLLTLDIVCHGVGSPMVWESYLKQYSSKYNILNIEHRNKKLGWERFSMKIELRNNKKNIVIQEDLIRNPYLRGFIHNIFLRPSCTNCVCKGFRSGSDFTCADFWGVKDLYPQLYDKNGVSLLTINTQKGKVFFDDCEITSTVVDYKKATQFNSPIYVSVKKHTFKNAFYFLLKKGVNFRILVLFIQFINKLHRIIVVNSLNLAKRML